ncbi:hypothetical protein BBK36DRAFT_1144537 [Trichoderma citrinoviride]|uniref:Uncharacterized protein n=1 Tax=Trichoderma citrinoviride TaxID=58853 RepID=A0A2T4AZW2_9HYPO|nr:hypothetical protein BBK36DRAFT_1144537 [Trichoderma citrinoviride]PTB62521.1 hypothetical protein BBK36DRAFT_1144537 [Trichoderma citrinoviride]
MALLQLAGLVTLIAFSSVAKAQITTPCTYQEYVCGSTLLANGYTALTDLRPAYAINPDAPTITDAQLGQVLFRCVDQAGGIVGNSYCIVGCAVIGDDTANDQCTM